MAQNLEYQIKCCIMGSFREHMDKHADKAAGETFGKIYSYTSRNATLDVSHDFCSYIKSHDPEVRRPDQITPDIVRSYLEDKVRSGCTQKTIDSYRDRLAKIGECVSARKGIDLDLKVDKVLSSRVSAADRGAEAVMSRTDFDKLLDYAASNPSASGFVLLLQNELGCRVEDICSGLKVSGSDFEIKCKGGKLLTRPITDRAAVLISKPEYAALRNGDRFKLPKSGSVNKYLSRVEKALGLERHSFHDTRRLLAQEKYDELRHAGLTRSEALSKVSVWLNHGEKRSSMILKSYISNAW